MCTHPLVPALHKGVLGGAERLGAHTHPELRHSLRSPHPLQNIWGVGGGRGRHSPRVQKRRHPTILSHRNSSWGWGLEFPPIVLLGFDFFYFLQFLCIFWWGWILQVLLCHDSCGDSNCGSCTIPGLSRIELGVLFIRLLCRFGGGGAWTEKIEAPPPPPRAAIGDLVEQSAPGGHGSPAHGMALVQQASTFRQQPAPPPADQSSLLLPHP